MPETHRPARNAPADVASDELANLIGQVAEGDHRAFHRLYELTNRKLFGVALLLLKRRDKAEDALQDAFVRIWTRAGTYDAERGLPLPWLARIVRNIALDQIRRKTVWTDDLGEHHETAAEAPVSVFAVAELNKCLAALDPAHRAAWWMTYLDGLSRDEVALRMNVPLGTVKSWVFRSSKRIKDAMES